MNDFSRHYQALTDERLVQIALREADELSSEGLAALLAEIKRRGLDGKLNSAVAIQTMELTPRMEDSLVEEFRRRPCPQCGRLTRPLNAVRITYLKHSMLFPFLVETVEVGCPNCLGSMIRSANVLNVFGCLVPPMGTFRGIQAICSNQGARQCLRDDRPTVDLLEVVKASRGVIVAGMAGQDKPA